MCLRFIRKAAEGFECDDASAECDGEGGGGEGALGNSFLQDREYRGEDFVLIVEGVEQRQ